MDETIAFRLGMYARRNKERLWTAAAVVTLCGLCTWGGYVWGRESRVPSRPRFYLTPAEDVRTQLDDMAWDAQLRQIELEDQLRDQNAEIQRRLDDMEWEARKQERRFIRE